MQQGLQQVKFSTKGYARISLLIKETKLHRTEEVQSKGKQRATEGKSGYSPVSVSKGGCNHPSQNS